MNESDWRPVIPSDPHHQFLARILDATHMTTRIREDALREDTDERVHVMLGNLTKEACEAYKEMREDDLMSVVAADSAIFALEAAVARAIKVQKVREVMVYDSAI